MKKEIFAVCFIPKHGDKTKIQNSLLDSLTNEGRINFEALKGWGFIPILKDKSLFLYSEDSPLVQAKVLIDYSLTEAEQSRQRIKAEHKALINAIFSISKEPKQSKGLILAP